MPRPKPMTVEAAETLALSALAYLAEDPARLSRFLSLTGMEPDDLRRNAGTQATQAAILDYILRDESLLLVFAASKGLKPDAIAPALALLAPESADE